MKKHIDDNCIFCKLANGQIPTNSIYEDDDFKVILDAAPAAKGHAIILPKTHAENLFELPEEYGEKIFAIAKKCGKAIKETYNYDGLNVLQNNGEAAGQTVKHFHMHLIPRYENDGQHILWNPGESTPEELEEIRKTITE